MKEQLLPVARPMILCDDVLLQPETGNVHLINVNNAIRPRSEPSYPHRHSVLCDFVQLTDYQGTLPAFVRVVEANSQTVLMRTGDHSLRFEQRQSVVRAVFRLVNCEFPGPGVYWMELYCHGQFLTDQVLNLLEPAS
jgi:hypothetical protein